MEKIKKNWESNNGITIVTLVVTIIILLILSAISLNLALGDNGIISKAQEASIKYGQAKDAESEQLDKASKTLDNLKRKNTTGTSDPVAVSLFETKGYSVGLNTSNQYIVADTINDILYTKNASGNTTSQQTLVYTDESVFQFNSATGAITGLNQSAITDSIKSTSMLVIPKTINGVKVTQVNLGGNNTSNYFTNSNLTVIIPYGVTHILNSSFDYWSQVRSIALPNTLVEIGNYAFRNNSLINLITPCSVNSIGGYAFYYNPDIVNLTVLGNGSTRIETWAFSSSGKSTATIGDGVYYIGSDAFYKSKITKATLADSVEILDYNAFYTCQELLDIDLGEGLKYIGRSAFYGDLKLKTLTIPDSVNYIGDHAFYDLQSLNSAVVGSGIKTFSEYSFNHSTIGNLTVNCPIIPYNAFHDCKITSINIQSNVKTIQKEAFTSCSSIQAVIINGSPTIESRAFQYCNTIQNFIIYDGIIKSEAFKNAYTTIGGLRLFGGTFEDYAFTGGTYTNVYVNTNLSATHLFESASISNLYLSNDVKIIPDSCFKTCTNLSTVGFPNSLTSIGVESFSGCSSLRTVYVPAGVTSVGARAFYGLASGSTIYVPNETVKNLFTTSVYTSGLTTVTLMN